MELTNTVSPGANGITGATMNHDVTDNMATQGVGTNITGNTDAQQVALA